jgi:Uma2 family endonuclease
MPIIDLAKPQTREDGITGSHSTAMSATPDEARPAKRPATYEDLLQVPDHKIAEIVDGDLYVSPMPGSLQSISGTRVGLNLGRFYVGGDDGPGGWWFLNRFELHFGADVLVPDVLAWRQSRLPHIPDVAFMTLAPDWICEVLSPETKEVDRKKLRIYAREGVRHAWLVDPDTQTLDVLRLESGEWLKIATYQDDAVILSEPFDALPFPLGRLWVNRR